MEYQSLNIHKSFRKQKQCVIYYLLIASVLAGYSLIPFHRNTNFEDSVQTSSSLAAVDESSGYCRDVYDIQDPEELVRNNSYGEIMKSIAEAKRKKTFGRDNYYNLLSACVPSFLKKAEPLEGSNGTFVTLKQESRLDQMGWKLPYLPCRLRKYSAVDVQRCIEERKRRKNSFHISFIGDSRVRRMMEGLLDLLQSFNLTIITAKEEMISLDDFLGDKGNIFWPKYKDRLSVRSSILPNFLINFFWAPLLSLGDSDETDFFHLRYLKDNIFPLSGENEEPAYKTENEDKFIESYKRSTVVNMSALWESQKNYRTNGAIDEIVRMLRMPVEHLPEFIIMNTGIWHLSDVEDVLYNIDNWAISGTLTLKGLLDKLASRTVVIFLLPEPIKEYFPQHYSASDNYFNMQTNVNQMWYLKSQVELLPENVVIWDSFLPFSYAAYRDCIQIIAQQLYKKGLPKFSRFNQLDSYSCFDTKHTGYEALSVAVQMLLNHICNRTIKKHQNERFCCNS